MSTLDKVFNKDYLSKVSRSIAEYTHSLLYWEDEPTPEQIESGWELVKLHYILAAIGDHIFDYFSYTYVLNDEQAEKYPDYFLDLTMYNLYDLVSIIKEDLNHHFSVLDTVSTEGLLVERDSWRETEHENNIREFVENLLEHSSELEEKFSEPKRVSDRNKPSADSIREVIGELTKLKSEIFKYASDPQLQERVFAFYNAFEQYRLACMFTWEKLKYGDHTQFMEEGDSMLPYMMFEIEAQNVLPQLLNLLIEQSPFLIFDRTYPFTEVLTKIIKYIGNKI